MGEPREDAWEEFIPFLDYDVEIGTVFCSTNAIESLNARYRRAVKTRGHFPTEQVALKCPYLVTRSLLDPYATTRIGAVGGRALNGIPGQEADRVDQIGRLPPNGRLTGNFAADPGGAIAVDHLLGANMSVRRSALTDVGGIRDYYPGTCLREETDSLLRIRAAGWGIVSRPM